MRINFSDYCMRIAETVALRSTCLRRHIGAVLVKDKQIIATGYNGAASRLPQCDERGTCLRDVLNIPSGTDLMNCAAVHAEANAIIQCALHGVSTKDAMLYCTNAPCMMCAKMIINAQIRAVIYKDEYPNMVDVATMFRDANVHFVKLGHE